MWWSSPYSGFSLFGGDRRDSLFSGGQNSIYDPFPSFDSDISNAMFRMRSMLTTPLDVVDLTGSGISTSSFTSVGDDGTLRVRETTRYTNANGEEVLRKRKTLGNRVHECIERTINDKKECIYDNLSQDEAKRFENDWDQAIRQFRSGQQAQRIGGQPQAQIQGAQAGQIQGQQQFQGQQVQPQQAQLGQPLGQQIGQQIGQREQVIPGEGIQPEQAQLRQRELQKQQPQDVQMEPSMEPQPAKHKEEIQLLKAQVEQLRLQLDQSRKESAGKQAPPAGNAAIPQVKA